MKRGGFVLPVVVVCAVLLASMVMTFQFISSSDYKQVARLGRGIQASALADLAADEIAATVNQTKYGTAGNVPAWVKTLFTQLDGAKGGAASGVIDVKQPVSYQLSQFPVTTAVAAKAGNLVELTDIKGVIGPFEILSGGGVKENIYKEALFNDANADWKAWDLRGPMNLEVSVAGTRGPFEFSQTYMRGQVLEIADTMPPAHDFAVFSYLPPPTEDYALNDLQRGGNLVISPGASAGAKTGRVLLQGPLVYVPEESPALPASPDKIHLGQEAPAISGPPGTSPSYPDNAWTDALATVPGPRELQHPDNTAGGIGGENLPGVDNTLVGAQSAMNPRRPGQEASDSRLKTKQFTITLTVNTLLSSPCPTTKEITVPLPQLDLPLGGISPILAKNLSTTGTTYETIDKDVVAYYPPMAYFHAPLPAGQQKVKLLATPPALLVDRCFKGIRVPKTGAPALFTGDAGNEGDVVITEPVPRTDQSDAENTGVLGLYGVALAESKTYLNIPIRTLGLWLTQKGIDRMPNKNQRVGFLAALLCSANPTYGEIAQANKETITDQTLAQLGLDTSLQFLIRRFAIEAKMTFSGPPTNLAPGTLKDRLGRREGVVVPYGSYNHETNFWANVADPNVKDAISKGIREAQNTGGTPEELLEKLLPEGTSPQINSVDGAWNVGQPAPDGTRAKVLRDYLTDTYAKELMRFTAAKAATDPGAALESLLGGARAVKGFAPLPAGVRPRPKGAFGPHSMAANGADVAAAQAVITELNTLYKNRGVFPPKGRDWVQAATRSYETLDEYLAAEKVGNTLELRGVVLVKKASTSANIQYSGRGVLIVMTEDAGTPATIGGTVTPAGGDATSHLTVVHLVKPDLVTAGRPPALVLGSLFHGTVLSQTGVKPKSSTLRIEGRLVTGLLNKQACADGDSVEVAWTADGVTAMPEAWTLESGGEVSSIDPTP